MAVFVHYVNKDFCGIFGCGICDWVRKRYLEKTSIAVIIFSYRPLGGKFGSKSICMASSGPKSNSGRLSKSGVTDKMGILLSSLQISHVESIF